MTYEKIHRTFHPKPCHDCREIFTPVSGNSPRCPDCAAEHRRKQSYAANLRWRNTKLGKDVGPRARKPVDWQEPRMRLLTRLIEMGWDKPYPKIPGAVIEAAAAQVGCPREEL